MKTRSMAVLFVLGMIVLAVVFVSGCGTSVPPKIASLTPSRGPVGTRVTIGGSAFGASQGSSKVAFATTAMAQVVSWSDTSIVVIVPQMAPVGSGFMVGVTVGGKDSNLYAFDLTPAGSTP